MIIAHLISTPQFNIWNISYITSHPFFTGSLVLTNDQFPTSVASWLSWLERRTGIARSRVQTPLKSWLFQASIRNCLNCVYNCDDHSSLDFNSAVQYTKHFIYHFISFQVTKYGWFMVTMVNQSSLASK